ncbi:homogentisate 1,2-dioxygenase [soil metagenome]
MPRYHTLGEIPPKHHVQFRRPDGGLYTEQLFSTRGFSGPMSTLYHKEAPTHVESFYDMGEVAPEYLPDEALRHRHFLTRKMDPHGDAVTGRLPIMGNSDVEWHQVWAAEPMESLYKNADGDECLFVHDGSGTLETLFGELDFRPGDYLVIPRGIIWRIRFDTLPVRILTLVSFGPIEVPRRYRNDMGQILEHAPYSERDLRAPSRLPQQEGPADVVVRARGRLTRISYPTHPFDVVGWDGFVWPMAFNINDFQPIVGRLHMPPPIHQTFHAPGFVVCSFCPRLLDFDPQAVPAPYAHSNVDSDEVLYYVNDKFGSRRGIEEGSITLHPLGIPHGPQPGATEASRGAPRTDEIAVMVDSFRPFKLCKGALDIEDETYWKSWQTPGGPAEIE